VAQGPLDGIRVVEAGGVGPTPFCGMLLADMGADVVRVDRDSAEDSFFRRGKRSITLDLKSAAGCQQLLQLADRADVLVEGFRPGVAERLGFGPDAVTSRNPALVYARCTGWGQTGPLNSLGGHDINYLAASGVLALIGTEGAPPAPPLNLLGDFAGGGLSAAFGVACALLERRRSGLGQVIDSSMVEGAALLSTMFHEMIAAGQHDEQRRGTNILDGGAPFYDVYETADGEWMAVGAIEAQFYQGLVEILGLDEAARSQQWDTTKWPELREGFRTAFRTRTRQEWSEVLAGRDVCATPVLRPSECHRDPHHVARSMIVDVGGVPQPAPAPKLSRTPAMVRHAGRSADVNRVLEQWAQRGAVHLPGAGEGVDVGMDGRRDRLSYP
jgi:alpha-methylacyl-CoA racemase